MLLGRAQGCSSGGVVAESGNGPLPLDAINRRNAATVLNELVSRPLCENTYSARLACLKADPAIASWQALTRNPAALVLLEKSDYGALVSRLAESGVWLPEVDNINSNIIANLLLGLATHYGETFRSLAFDKDRPRPVQDILIVRGTPAAGKTSFLQGRFAPGSDDAREMLQNRIPCLTVPQVHAQGAALFLHFSRVMESRLSQALPRDALYLWPKDFVGKLETVAATPGQKAVVHDLQVDLTTLCCRLLKRSTGEPLMNFSTLGILFKAALENRQALLASLEQHKASIDEYCLWGWNGTERVKVAERAVGSEGLLIMDQALFAEQVERSGPQIQAEIDRVGATRIDAAFIEQFVREMTPSTAQPFVRALRGYAGKTLGQALQLHADRAHQPVSVAARVLTAVIPG